MLQRFEEIANDREATIDAELLSCIRELALSRSEIEAGVKQLQQTYAQNKCRPNIASPYPYLYYEMLLRSMQLLLRTANLGNEEVESEWQTLVRVVLYMCMKRIPMGKYGQCFVGSHARMQLTQIPLYRFGPVNCKIANFYCFISIGSAAAQMRELLKNKLTSLDQHFKTIQAEYSFNEQQILLELDNDESRIQNYFIGRCPSQKQWETFLINLKNKGIRDTFCQIILITQSPQSYYAVKEDTYPLSIETISNAYLETYLSHKHERLLKDKIVHLRKVTAQLQDLKNSVPPSTFKRVQVTLHSLSENPLIQNAIKLILTTEPAQDKTYYPLIARIDKHKQGTAHWQIDAALSGLIGIAHPSVPVLYVPS